MTERNNKPSPIGTFVRKNVIPEGMSVKDAAKRLGIGRPALSNFLNGRSSLSAKMAVRLEKAFGADRKKLLEMQSSYDQQKQRTGEKRVAVRAFVPNFLTIKARQIEEWANNHIDARSHLPVFLRKLVHSTGNNLRKVDFPGYDNAQRKGPDGYIDAGAATPWIPEGISYWEFGTEKNAKGKANIDYAARVKNINLEEREKSTFVFVTPRNWHGKTIWEKEKNEKNDWMSVRVFDANDLEQWLEQSVPAQIWLAEQLAITISGFETLEQAWHRWIYASEPHLKSEIFEPSIAAHRNTLKTWLNKPSEKPFVVAADSRDEALAFLACLFDDEELSHFKDLAAIFTSPSALRTLLASSVPFVPIVHSVDVERELADAHKRLHCIVFRPRNAVDTEADVTLDLLGYDAFEKALKSMKLEENDIERLARESGLSPTILRRRLSKNAAIRTPAWARNDEAAKKLIPMVLIGAWHAEPEADRKIVSYVADRKYDEIEDDVAGLLLFDDSPVWSTGRYRGVTSKIDSLFAIARVITTANFDRFFTAAEYVLSESDPALDLPEKDRWAAAVYGKTRDHSSALRDGICETLIILSVHGNNLFQWRLGINLESRVVDLIRKLLTPLTPDKLLSHDYNLPRYAEAAPDEFLKILEADLKCENPIIFCLLKPADSGLFWTSPSRTGLLWALECLAWKPQNLLRVSQILAQLCRANIEDNWANKPENSLKSIFRSWMPQTAASIDQRIKVIERLCMCFPDVGWELCIDQIRAQHVGDYTYRPRWRNDASGAGQVVTNKERFDFRRKALDLLIDWPSHNERSLGDLVEPIKNFPEKDQTKICNLIDEWALNADDSAKAKLRERIRRFALTLRSRHLKLGKATRDRVHEVYDRLRPNNPVNRHSWLFADQWVPESIMEIEEEDFDYQRHHEQIDKLRREALIEIWSESQFEGIEKMLIGSGAERTVGYYATSCITEIKPRVDFIRHCLTLGKTLQIKAEGCLQGFLLAIDEDSRVRVLQAASEGLSDEESRRLFLCAPFCASTWRLLDSYSEKIRVEYWKDVMPSWNRYTPAEINELIDRLLEAKRPRAAFYAVHMDFKNIETSRLKRLLRDVATIHDEPTDHFTPSSHQISDGLDSLGNRTGTNSNEMAQLEFFFIHALDNSKHGIPNLEKQISQLPALFVQALAFAFKRSDDMEDPPEWRIENPEQRATLARAARRLLQQIKRIPGTKDNGKIDAELLTEWINEVRRLCREFGRASIGDQYIGQLLSKAPRNENDQWPCKEICEVMEKIASSEIGIGFDMGVYNSRGAHWGGKGGEQERKLAADYHALAERLHFDYPYVAGVLTNIAKSYERQAAWEDTEEAVTKRLR